MSLATLTITVYMILQGLAPSFWGSLSDIIGRRVIFISTFIVYILANIALGVSTNYGELMAFRAVQAAGSSATISIGTPQSNKVLDAFLIANMSRCGCYWGYYYLRGKRKPYWNFWWW